MTKVGGESAKSCMLERRPNTPPHIKKYRQAAVQEPGTIFRHYGVADDEVKEGPFGVASVRMPDDSVSSVMGSYPRSKIMQWELENREKICASTNKEPLGRAMVRGHEGPKAIETFGMDNNSGWKNKNPEAKGLIHPKPTDEETPQTIANYVKSHGNFAPGEQKKRNYDWQAAGINPEKNAFGITEERIQNQLAKVLQQEDLLTTNIVPKRLAEFRMVNTDELGKVKKLGHGDRGLGATHTFGVASRRFDEWGVGELIKGDYTEDEQAPDYDLGKSLRVGFRNERQYNEDGVERVFGAPTIRTDIPAPGTKSVADNNNYGNEPDALTLLYPSTAAERGVFDEDYIQLRPKEEMKTFLGVCGIEGLEDDLFDSLYDLAAEKEDKGGVCSLYTFLTTKKRFDMHKAFA